MPNFTTAYIAAIILVLYSMAPIGVSAQEATADIAEFQRCLEVADGDDNLSRNECIGTASGECIGQFSTASGKATCWSKETELWDDLLNNDYQELRNSSPSDVFKNELKNAQRAWIKFRDADCGLFSAMGIGGAPESQLYEGCIMEHTARRATALADLASILRQVAN